MSIFVRSAKQQEPGFNVGMVLGRKSTAGDVGLEIEVEGNKFPKPEGYEGTHSPRAMPGLPGWSYVHDGSLRGKDNAEYVLTSPILFKDVDKKVRALYKHLDDFGSKFTESNRTSVHVHLNCQTFHFNRLTSFLALYFTLEEVLAEWCGDHRVGNLFCLRAVDAPAIVSQLRRFIRSNGKTELREQLHYAGLNAHALMKFGSLEVRLLRGCDEPDTIITWVRILQRIYDISADYPDPRDIMGAFSQYGPNQFFETILGDVRHDVMKGVNLTYDDIGDRMLTGIRLAQSLCYCRDWDLFKAMKVEPDPFGRKAKDVMRGILGVMSSNDPAPAPFGSVTISQPIPSGWSNAIHAEPEAIFDEPQWNPETGSWE